MIYFVLFCLLFFLFCCSYLEYRDDLKKWQAEFDEERLLKEERLRKEELLKEAGVNEDSEGSNEQY